MVLAAYLLEYIDDDAPFHWRVIQARATSQEWSFIWRWAVESWQETNTYSQLESDLETSWSLSENLSESIVVLKQERTEALKRSCVTNQVDEETI